MVPYCYPISGRLEDHLLDLAGSEIFASIDAEGAFNQILMDPESVPLTAICTPFGLWEFLAMGFGLQSAPGFWCKLMDCTFSALPFVKYWVDDIFYGSQDTSIKSKYEVHLEQTKQVFQACRANGIRLSTLKTRFGLREIVFGGHCISKGKYNPEPKKIDAIRRATIPTTVGELMRFLGAINWVGKYCPLLSRRTYHLRKHLKLATGAVSYTHLTLPTILLV